MASKLVKRQPNLYIFVSSIDLISEQASDFVETPSDASQSGLIATAIVEHPLIRIHSGRILGALDIMWAFLSLVMLVRFGFG